MRGYLYSLKNKGMKLGLERIQMLAHALGEPQEGFTSILVGGTSGKGSTAAMISSMLKEHGYKVGRYTSPHISDLTERIAIGGRSIPEEELEKIVGMIKDVIEGMRDEPGFEHPTFFEVMTAAAMHYFKESEVDYAVLEVGLGGRLDATNIAPAAVSVITNVSLEHTNILGNSVEEIANEKAGIVKEGKALVTAARGRALRVLEQVCEERSSTMVAVGREVVFNRTAADIKGQDFAVELADRRYERLRIPLLGKHQLENASCAIGAVHALGIADEESVRRGLWNVRWPGRFEIVQEGPLVILDCAKDAAAMARLREAMADVSYKRLVLVLGISSDKDIGAMIDEIAPLSDDVIITAHKAMGRAADPEAIAKEVSRHSKDFQIVMDVRDAVERALSMAGKEDAVLVTGSLFTVAEARGIWHPETVYKA